MSCVDVILGNGTTFLFVKCSPHSGISLSCLGISIGVFLSKTQLNYTQSHPGSSPQLQKTASQDSISSTAKSPHWNHTLRLQEVSTALVFFFFALHMPPNNSETKKNQNVNCKLYQKQFKSKCEVSILERLASLIHFIKNQKGINSKVIKIVKG